MYAHAYTSSPPPPYLAPRRKSNPEYTHMLWREADWDAFVAAHGAPRERRAYAALRRPEPKAALLRLLFLREVGGVCPAAGTEIGTPLRRLLPPRATALLGDTWWEWQHLATLGDTWWFEVRLPLDSSPKDRRSLTWPPPTLVGSCSCSRRATRSSSPRWMQRARTCFCREARKAVLPPESAWTR